ncbi:hypothetical protein [Streptomyces huiliensis]|uniref:hypothetical protein n=1 Tax=Streptomyces huiliensis TaxID=2876027 RepID=UPI001CBAE7D3|nr:hypothetical protein [Streptomyces huiliensis]MBZ4323300.1 hypothetical protein [Streptomyces huiliensis]
MTGGEGTAAPVRPGPDARLVEVDDGAILLHRAVPAAAWVSPAALRWMRGAPVPPDRAADFARCVESWRSAGLVRDHDREGEPAPTEEPANPADPAGAGDAVVSHPVLVVASSPGCGYCRQLRTDLDANRRTLTARGVSVLLVGEGSPAAWGAGLKPPQAEELAGTYAHLGRLGTPSAVRLSPGGGAAHPVVRGFEAVTATLVELCGAEPGRVVCETPTSCSAGVNGAPVDALVVARAGGRAVGIAARGEEAVRVAALAAEATGTGADAAGGYVPVTLLVERPRNLWLVFRGGELVGRSRDADEALDVLRRMVAGFESPGVRQVRLLCGALVHGGGERALLFPRNWMSYLVARSASLARAGWRPCPDPFASLEAGPDGTPLLCHPSRPAGPPRHTPVAGVLAPRPTAPMPGVHVRARSLTRIANWAVRPVPPEQVGTVCALLAGLPVHLGTQEEALAFLTGSPAP